jgi:hypothetical protein
MRYLETDWTKKQEPCMNLDSAMSLSCIVDILEIYNTKSTWTHDIPLMGFEIFTKQDIWIVVS